MKETEKNIIAISLIFVCIVLFSFLVYFLMYIKLNTLANEETSQDTEIIVTKDKEETPYRGIYPEKNSKNVDEVLLKELIYKNNKLIKQNKVDFKNNKTLKYNNIKYKITCNTYDNDKCTNLNISFQNNNEVSYNTLEDNCYDNMKLLLYQNYLITQSNNSCSNDINIFQDKTLVKTINNSVTKVNDLNFPLRIWENRLHYLVLNNGKIEERYIVFSNDLLRENIVRIYLSI